jgi:hypothetical protein
MELAVAIAIVVLVVAALAVTVLYQRRNRRGDPGASSNGSIVTEGERNARAGLWGAGRTRDWDGSSEVSGSGGGSSGGDGGGGGGD